MGPRDMENGTVEIARRDTLEKEIVPLEGIEERIEKLLEEIQHNLYQKALDYRKDNIRKADTWDEFKDILDNKKGFILAHWDGTSETEQKIKDETKATIRVIPMDGEQEEGKCIYSGKPSKQRVVFALSY